jgi:hypothetical protein
MQHKLYNLDSKQTFLGIDMSDIMVGMTTWMLGNFLAGEFLPPRLRMLAIFASMGLALVIWRAFKDKLPPGFFRHLPAWASEANAYRIGPDTKARPAVVDHQRVLGFLEQEKKDRLRLSRMPAKEVPSRNTEVRPNLKHTVQLTPPPRPAPDEVAQDTSLTPKVGVGSDE